jgi:hypothetical protein
VIPNIDLSVVPDLFANFLGIDTFSASFLVFAILTVVVLLPFITMGKSNYKLMFIIGFLLLCFGVAIAWIPVWVFGIILLAIAFDTAKRLRKVFS